jgi:flagellar basal-body rod modification protein FlgD
MDIPLTMNERQLAKTGAEVERFNKSLKQAGRRTEGTLGKEDFLRLLVVQLENQDPTNPLDDKEFIAQTAQFSSLEQMTEMNKTLEQMIGIRRTSQAYSLLGKYVDVFDETRGEVVSGLVNEIKMSGGEPKITFNGLQYSVDDVTRVSNQVSVDQLNASGRPAGLEGSDRDEETDLK